MTVTLTLQFILLTRAGNSLTQFKGSKQVLSGIAQWLMPVFGWRTSPAVRQIYGWLVTTLWVNCQTQPAIPLRSVNE